MNTHRYHTQIVRIIGEKHLTADDIFIKMRKRFDRVGIATIYRNLDKLVDDGTLMKLTGIFDKTYYERNKGYHAHLIDPETYNITDVIFDPKSLVFPDDFVLKDAQINFMGSREGDVPSGDISLLPSPDDSKKNDIIDQEDGKKSDEKESAGFQEGGINNEKEKTISPKDNGDSINVSDSSEKNDIIEKKEVGQQESGQSLDKKQDSSIDNHKIFREF